MLTLRNLTRIETGPNWCRTTLPTGDEVFARPNADSPAMAEKLGYDTDVELMTAHHDALHSLLADMLGLTASRSLMHVAGCWPDGPDVWAEEDAVLAVQRYARLIEWEGIV
jgi:hypothetical protein